jgi:hypothetical protein
VNNAISVAATPYDYLYAYTSTAEACLALPEDLYYWAVPYLFDNYVIDYYYDNFWGYYFDCSMIDSLPTIDLLFGGYWLEVLVDDYVINFGDGTCALCITESPYYDEAHFGSAVMRGFYFIHDHDNARQGIAPLASGLRAGLTASSSGKVAPVAGTTPTC